MELFIYWLFKCGYDDWKKLKAFVFLSEVAPTGHAEAGLGEYFDLG